MLYSELVKIKLNEIEASLKSLRSLIESEESETVKSTPVLTSREERQKVTDRLVRESHIAMLNHSKSAEPEKRKVIANVDNQTIPIPNFTEQ